MPQAPFHQPDSGGNSAASVTGLVHSVESCGTVDGPGIRFVLFLSGCSLRCRYCHNPDASYVRRGQTRSAADILEELARYRDFLQAAGGGLTLSGGDPLFQPAFAKAVLKGGKAMGLHTCLDTSGHLGSECGRRTAGTHGPGPAGHQGMESGTLPEPDGRRTAPHPGEFAERLAALRKPVWLRYVLVPGLTDDMEDMAQLARCARRLGNVERVDILPFHQMGRFKWDELDLDYTLRDVREPSAELTEQARSIFRREGISRYEVH